MLQWLLAHKLMILAVVVALALVWKASRPERENFGVQRPRPTGNAFGPMGVLTAVLSDGRLA